MRTSREEGKYWSRCEDCGQFIGLDEFDNGRAVRKVVYPDSEYTQETYETYHVQCAHRREMPK